MTKPENAPASRWPTLHPTTQAAYNLILWRDGLPRIEIARLLGVSRTRMSQITKDLEEFDLIVEGPREQRGTTGRPAEILLARVDRFHLLGVTVRSRVLVAAVVDLGNRVVWERSTVLEDVTVGAVVERVQDWYAAAVADGFAVVGVAVTAPGSSPSGAPSGVHASDLDGGVDWAVPVPVWPQEDVLALTTFEQWPRLGEGQDSMVLLALGEEIAFGIVTDLRAVAGAHRAAGRFGHVVVDDDGVGCPVGHRWCLWSTSSTGAVVAAVPDAADLQAVVGAAAAGDAHADAVLRRAARGAGTAAAQVVNLLDPDKVVVAGEMSGVVRSYRSDFDDALTTAVVSGVEPIVEIATSDVVQWAQAAAAYAQYRLLTPGTAAV